MMEEERVAAKQGRLTKKQQQQTLDFKTVTGPQEFTRAGILDAVVKLIATNNQVSHYGNHRHYGTNTPSAAGPH
jgi:hypothetical protein